MGHSGEKRGSALGPVVAVAFGTAFVVVNSAALARPWPTVVRLTGLAVAATLVVAVVRAVRTAPPPARVPASGFADRRYWTVVGLEAAALFGGLYLVNGVLHRTGVSVAWVAFVVGVHFFGLGWIWRMSVYHALGAVIAALGVAGFWIRAAGGTVAAVDLVAGVGSGVVLYAAVALSVREAVRRRRAARDGGVVPGGGRAPYPRTRTRTPDGRDR